MVLSSGAVNTLSENELEYVIGHELGHAQFAHIEVPTGYLLQRGSLEPRHRMLVTSWHRAAEISADRFGLLCCGSLRTAATALFKTLSGLTLANASVDPSEFAAQWEDLAEEVIRAGHDDHWELTHPFPPLRMKAMILFAEASKDKIDGISQQVDATPAAADSEIERLLAMMDPLARRKTNNPYPILGDFFLWGGLYIALANGVFEASERSRLEELCTPQKVASAISSGLPSMETCLDRFSNHIADRYKKISAMEMHRIIRGLLEIAYADGEIDADETGAIANLASKLGINEKACELLTKKFLEEN